MRIARYLASCGLASRRKCEEFVLAGRVKLNDEIIFDLGRQLTPEVDIVMVDDKPCRPGKKVYYVVNKPAGYTSSVMDKHAENLVTELVPSDPPVWPVGRLDKETTGLLILTNDGDLTQKLIHPKHKLEKEYLVNSKNVLSETAQSRIREGIVLADGPIKADFFEETSPGLYKIVVHEGRNRLVRRIFKYFDIERINLKRTREANISLGDLAEGKYRELTKAEIEELSHE